MTPKRIELDDRFAAAFSRCITSVNARLAVAPPGETAEDKRQRYVLSLAAIGKFFGDLDQPNVAKELQWLATALFDLDDGTTHPVLMARKREGGGRRPDSGEVWSARAKVAIAVECFHRAGKLDSAIDVLIRKKRAALERLLRPGADLKTAPFGWLEQIKSGQTTNLHARGRWEMFEMHFGSQARTVPEWADLGNQMLESAAADASRLVASEII